MFSRSISDGLPIANSPSSNSVVRAELAIGAPSELVELPQRAVPEAASPQPLPQDHQRLNQEAKSLEKIRSTMDSIERSKEDSAKLEAIRAKLMLSYKSVNDTGVASPAVEDVLDEAAVTTDLLLGADARKSRELQAGLMQSGPQTGVVETGTPDKDSVLGKIEAAISRIGQLQDKLGRVERKDYDVLLGLNLFVSGLNAARTQVDDSSYSVSAASSSVENILMNIRAAVVAHGRASPEIVRLVLVS